MITGSIHKAVLCRIYLVNWPPSFQFIANYSLLLNFWPFPVWNAHCSTKDCLTSNISMNLVTSMKLIVWMACWLNLEKQRWLHLLRPTPSIPKKHVVLWFRFCPMKHVVVAFGHHVDPEKKGNLPSHQPLFLWFTLLSPFHSVICCWCQRKNNSGNYSAWQIICMLPCMLLISAATMHTETVFGKWLPTAGVPWSFDVFENDMFFFGGGGGGGSMWWILKVSIKCILLTLRIAHWSGENFTSFCYRLTVGGPEIIRNYRKISLFFGEPISGVSFLLKGRLSRTAWLGAWDVGYVMGVGYGFSFFHLFMC